MNRDATRKRALIIGISGQDGAYLARLLLSKGYQVVGTSRTPSTARSGNLAALGIAERLSLVQMSPADPRQVAAVVGDSVPDEVYYLAGQSSVAQSFENPEATMSSIAAGCVNTLEAIRQARRPIRLYNAGSGDCFGNTQDGPANEQKPLRPLSPYGIAKAAAIWECAIYREVHGLYACSGLMFNHESPLRPERFVTQKIAAAARRIARGSDERLRLGNIEVKRDWGWAPEYVEAMWLMLQQPSPRDYVIATGRSHRLAEFVDECFAAVNLSWREHVDVDAEFSRAQDVVLSEADPALAATALGWRAQHDMSAVARLMVQGVRDVARMPGA